MAYIFNFNGHCANAPNGNDPRAFSLADHRTRLHNPQIFVGEIITFERRQSPTFWTQVFTTEFVYLILASAFQLALVIDSAFLHWGDVGVMALDGLNTASTLTLHEWYRN